VAVAARNLGGPVTFVVDAEADLATIVGPRVGQFALALSEGTLWYHTGSAWTEASPSAGGGGAPTDANYLVGTANAGLSAEIPVGTTPGGELGGTWASPTVDSSHAGGTHAAAQAAAEATAAAANTADIATHAGAADPHTGYQKESEKSAASGYASLDGTTKVPIAELPTGTTGSTVALGNAAAGLLATHEADTTSVHGITDTSALETTTGSAAKVTTHEAAADPHTGYQRESEKAAASGYASLDGSTKVPIAQIPTGTSSSTVALGDAAAALDATHAAAADPHTGYVLESLLDAKGDLITASADNTPSKLTVGADDTILMADASAGGGLKWVASASPSAVSTAAATGTADTFTRGDHVHAHETAHTAHDTVWDTKGDLVAATGADAASKLAIGTEFIDVLIPDTSATTGLKWGMARNPLRPTGALFETFPRQGSTGTNVAALVSQTVRMDAIALPSGLTITSISWVSGTTALVTGVHQYFGLYDSSLNLLRATGDDTSTAWAANTVKTLNLTSTYATTTAGLYYLAILVQATTVPTLTGIVNTSSGHMGSPTIGGPSSTAQTSLPNPAAAISSVSGNRCYAYVS
jgi:hypothetical protein